VGDREFVRGVAEDLDYLRDTWKDDISDSLLRQSSTTLRRLTIHGDYGRAWRVVGFPRQPFVRATSLDPLLQRENPKRLLYASPGGAKIGGAEGGQVIVPKPLYGLPAPDPSDTQTFDIGLSAFMDGVGAVARGVLVRRRDIVKFASEKLGGAHYDERRNDSEEFAALEWATRNPSVEILGKPLIYFDPCCHRASRGDLPRRRPLPGGCVVGLVGAALSGD
jgi:hypothetical protein